MSRSMPPTPQHNGMVQAPRAGTLSIEMEGQGHRLRVRRLDWLFVRADEVAIHPGSLLVGCGQTFGAYFLY